MTSIIHLEDNPLDHKLVSARLEEYGFTFDIHRVETRQAFLESLQSCKPSLILGDYNLPQFDGLTALRLAKELCPNIPFIILSGAMGEMAAVDVLKAGATDYVLKDRLERLGPAVQRALHEAAERAAHLEAQQQVREARDLAEAANRAKDHFLAVLSHELRTPLTPVLTTVQTIEADVNLPGEFREPIQMIRRNVQLEVKLIDDLLDLTRLTKGKLELNIQTLDAHETVRQVLSICDSDLRGKRMTIELNLNASNARCGADPARLQQILWNVLKNAVKFTNEGGVIAIGTRNTANGQLEIAIKDSGIGIDPDVLGRIFDAFEQGGKQITRQFGGLGLGLAISRALAEQHGGSLRASSEGTGKGATFTLSLPLSKAVPADATKPRANGQAKGVLANCRVLLVDDHLDTARAMGKLLRQWGCDVHVADSVSTALQAANANPFDVLVSDIGLPDGSGIDLMRQLLARRPIKGIAISGFGMEEDLRQSKSAGFCEHLVKPIDLEKLLTTLRRVVEPQA